MTRINTFVVIAVVIVVAVYARRLAVQLLGPGSFLFELAANATMFGGQELAEEIYIAVTVWVPWFIVAGAILGGLYREFWKSQVTRRVR